MDSCKTEVVHLRQAEERDAETIAIIKRTSAAELSSTYGEEALTRRADNQPPQHYVTSIKKNEITVAVSTDGDLVGFGQLVDTTNSSECELKMLFVLPKWTGKGVGSALLRHMEEQAKISGCVSVRIAAALNAEGFYEKKGYSFDPTNKFLFVGEFQCILMRKNIV